MPQELHINLDGKTHPQFDILKDGDNIVECWGNRIQVVQMKDGTSSGWPTVVVLARIDETSLAAITITAKNFLNAAGAIRGSLIKEGLLEQSINPGVAFTPHVVGQGDKKKACISFSSEVPLSRWVYDLAEAKKFWRELRRMCDEADSMLRREQ